MRRGSLLTGARGFVYAVLLVASHGSTACACAGHPVQAGQRGRVAVEGIRAGMGITQPGLAGGRARHVVRVDPADECCIVCHPDADERAGGYFIAVGLALQVRVAVLAGGPVAVQDIALQVRPIQNTFVTHWMTLGSVRYRTYAKDGPSVAESACMGRLLACSCYALMR